ncbi:MAG: TrgA family protein [Hasllibacter sp.]
MPTPARFLAALAFAAMGYALVVIAVQQLPPETRTAGLGPVAALFGWITGWRFVGSRVGQGFQNALATGLSGGVLLILSILAFGACVLMLRQSVRFAYADPLEAVVDAISMGIEHGALVSTPLLYGVALGGGVLVALTANGLNRYWR